MLQRPKSIASSACSDGQHGHHIKFLRLELLMWQDSSSRLCIFALEFMAPSFEMFTCADIYQFFRDITSLSLGKYLEINVCSISLMNHVA